MTLDSSNLNEKDPADIMNAAAALTALQTALAADLATTIDPNAMAKLMIQAANGAQVTVHLLGYELEEFLNQLIQDKLTILESLGVNTSGILEAYKNAAEKGLQARKENGG